MAIPGATLRGFAASTSGKRALPLALDVITVALGAITVAYGAITVALGVITKVFVARSSCNGSITGPIPSPIPLTGAGTSLSGAQSQVIGASTLLPGATAPCLVAIAMIIDAIPRATVARPLLFATSLKISATLQMVRPPRTAVGATRGMVTEKEDAGQDLATTGNVAITTVSDRIPLAYATPERYNGRSDLVIATTGDLLATEPRA